MWLSRDDLAARKSERLIAKNDAIEAFADSDIVGQFLHNRPANLDNLKFERHSKSARKAAPIMSVRSKNDDNTVMVGKDVPCIDEGFDFAVAIVDKQTGEAFYRPARFYQFESKYTDDIEQLLGPRKGEKAVDYEKDFGITAEKWAEKRRQLTSNFGSSKKIKMDEAAQRRTIDTETLDEMRKTAFVSNDVKEEDDVKLADITMVQKAESSVLPPAVQADLSKDIYPISLFLDQSEIDAVAEEAVAIMEKKRKDKKAAGVPEPVLLIMFNEKTPTRAAAYLLLATMVEILQAIGKNRSILKKDLKSLKMPDVLRQKVQAEYFINSTSDRGITGREAERIRLTTTEYDRFVAYTLALALTLAPEHKVPISPFQVAVHLPPRKFETMLTALGADLMRLDVASAQQMNSLRAAMLLKPPSKEQKPTKRLKRR